MGSPDDRNARKAARAERKAARAERRAQRKRKHADDDADGPVRVVSKLMRCPDEELEAFQDKRLPEQSVASPTHLRQARGILEALATLLMRGDEPSLERLGQAEAMLVGDGLGGLPEGDVARDEPEDDLELPALGAPPPTAPLDARKPASIAHKPTAESPWSRGRGGAPGLSPTGSPPSLEAPPPVRPPAEMNPPPAPSPPAAAPAPLQPPAPVVKPPPVAPAVAPAVEATDVKPPAAVLPAVKPPAAVPPSKPHAAIEPPAPRSPEIPRPLAGPPLPRLGEAEPAPPNVRATNAIPAIVAPSAETEDVDGTVTGGAALDPSTILPFRGRNEPPPTALDEDEDALSGTVAADDSSFAKTAIPNQRFVPPDLPFKPLALPDLSLEQYASLCAEREQHPEDAEAIRRRWAVESDVAEKALDRQWQERLRADGAAAQRFYKLLTTYKTWLASQGQG